ncbi:MAG: hypothetical protein FWC50_15520 [Planctomycetaceae bacterium]|nr:hypothetical protein [Planctomycetaceae bacterium]
MTHFLPANARPYNNAYTVYVSPELAKKWLEECNVFNRPINQEVVDMYVRQIKSGLWRRTHQGVAFTDKKSLLDGQHRLMAIVIAQVTVPMLIFMEEPKENYEYIDCGRNRSNLEIVRMSSRNETLKLMHTQTLKAMLAGRHCKGNKYSNAELGALYRRYSAAVDFAVAQLGDYPVKQINDPTVRGVIARACYYLNKDQLIDFCNLLKGQSQDHPAAKMVNAFRDCLMIWDDRRENTKREIYKRCECILKAIQNNDVLVGFPTATGELFPINHDNC